MANAEVPVTVDRTRRVCEGGPRTQIAGVKLVAVALSGLTSVF